MKLIVGRVKNKILKKIKILTYRILNTVDKYPIIKYNKIFIYLSDVRSEINCNDIIFYKNNNHFIIKLI